MAVYIALSVVAVVAAAFLPVVFVCLVQAIVER